MWKLAIAFVAFAALAMFILTRSGNADLDLTGEKHSVEAPHAAPATAATPAAAASAAALPVAPAAASASKP
jgi:hypothetical protein